jgi:hypothetical protein
MKSLLHIMVFLLNSILLLSQKTEVTALISNGTIVGGYVDNGAYLNFTGPAIKLQRGSSDLMIGVLPSLRFKEDNGITKNSLVTPSLGIGFTYNYKSFAIQMPLYYNAKTNTQNGSWQLGLGVGYKIKK